MDKVIAHGGGGIIHLGKPLNPALREYGETVIVKEYKQHATTKASFMMEIGLLEYFKDSEHVAKVLGSTEDPCCLIMKYYKLGNLRSFLNNNKKRRLPVIISFAHDIAAGIFDLHITEVVHNDLKPENIRLDQNRSTGIVSVVLTDFGISQIVNSDLLTVKVFDAKLYALCI